MKQNTMSIDEETREFAHLFARMSPEQKKFLAECCEELDAGRCTFDEMLAKIDAGLVQAGT